ncbi:MAG TPA: GNAT family N-acetyltransferase [bacterium]|jgi:ribosomal protein S18 acetylase RimI-like enzyme
MEITIRKIDKYDPVLIKYLFSKIEYPNIQPKPEFFISGTGTMLVAYHDSDACGFLYAYTLHSPARLKPKMFLYSIDVFGNDRRHKVASSLIKRLKEIAREENCSEIFVLTDKYNFAAMALYETTGGVTNEAEDIMYVYNLE